MRLAIDFDGVIHDTKHRKQGFKMGEPMSLVQTYLPRLAAAGHEIVVFSTRATNESGRQAIVDWMDHFNLPYDEVTAVKPQADLYLDDRAIHFTDWIQAFDEITRWER